MIELVNRRKENSKTSDLGGGNRALDVHIGAIHYKDNYADKSEQWKDIDLTWEGNRITKAPYELTLEGNKITIRDKKTGEISTLELLEIGGKAIPAQAWEHSKGLAKAADLEIVAQKTRVSFTRVLKSDIAPKEAKYRVTGNIPLRVRAGDAEGRLPVEWTLKDGILTETLEPDRPIKYPVRIDPTIEVSVGAGTDDVWVLTDNDVWTIESGLNYLDLGWSTTRYELSGAGMRFLDVTIPDGTTITTAYIIVNASLNLSGADCNTRISGEDAINGATFSDFANYKERRGVDGGADGRTTAIVDCDELAAWTAGINYNSCEIKTIVQEWVDDNSGLSGDNVVLFWDDHDDRSTHNGGATRRFYSQEHPTEPAPILHIEYPSVETTYDTPVGAKTSWAWDKCDYEGAEECPVGAKTSWAWGAPTEGANLTMQGSKTSWAWDTT